MDWESSTVGNCRYGRQVSVQSVWREAQTEGVPTLWLVFVCLLIKIIKRKKKLWLVFVCLQLVDHGRLAGAALWGPFTQCLRRFRQKITYVFSPSGVVLENVQWMSIFIWPLSISITSQREKEICSVCVFKQWLLCFNYFMTVYSYLPAVSVHLFLIAYLILFVA